MPDSCSIRRIVAPLAIALAVWSGISGSARAAGEYRLEAGAGLEGLYDRVPDPLAAPGVPAAGLIVRAELRSSDAPEFDAYSVTVADGVATVDGTSRAAVLYGIEHLARELASAGSLDPELRIDERAALRTRALHLMMRNMTAERLTSLIDIARSARMNTLLLYTADDIELQSQSVVPGRRAISRDDFSQVIAYAKASGMQVIPHVPLLTKQHRFFKQDFPALMYNNSTYDPRNPETMQRVHAYLEELIELMQPPAIHIGHDEVEGSFKRRNRSKWTAAQKKKWLAPGDEMLPPELFLTSVEELHEWLGERGLETWMWGDMLIAYSEFPEMEKKNMHGNFGYTELRSRLPDEIVICDWHYWDTKEFTTAGVFAAEGHDVLGSTRELPANIENFTRYVAGMGPRGRGMIATLWSLVNSEPADEIEAVIRRSGDAYWSGATN